MRADVSSRIAGEGLLKTVTSLPSYLPTLRSSKCAFTLAEVLITLAIIGVVAALTLSSLIQRSVESELVNKLVKFNSSINQAVLMAINEQGNIYFSGRDNDFLSFDVIAKHLKYVDKCWNTAPITCYRVSWLPDYSYDYLGEKGTDVTFGAVAKRGYGIGCYLLYDGTTFCLDINPSDVCITVDLNGKKKPNRIGRDIFSFTLTNQRVIPEEFHSNTSGIVLSTHGTCSLSKNNCDPTNLDPNVKGGAAPTAYTLLYKKLPPIYKQKK